jgi:hypothetical protein
MTLVRSNQIRIKERKMGETLTLNKGVGAYLTAVHRIPPPCAPRRRPRVAALPPLSGTRHRGCPGDSLGNALARAASLKEPQSSGEDTEGHRRTSGLADILAASDPTVGATEGQLDDGALLLMRACGPVSGSTVASPCAYLWVTVAKHELPPPLSSLSVAPDEERK